MRLVCAGWHARIRRPRRRSMLLAPRKHAHTLSRFLTHTRLPSACNTKHDHARVEVMSPTFAGCLSFITRCPDLACRCTRCVPSPRSRPRNGDFTSRTALRARGALQVAWRPSTRCGGCWMNCLRRSRDCTSNSRQRIPQCQRVRVARSELMIR